MIVFELVDLVRPDKGQVQLRRPGRVVRPEEDTCRQHCLDQSRLADLRRCLVVSLLVGVRMLRRGEEDETKDGEEC